MAAGVGLGDVERLTRPSATHLDNSQPGQLGCKATERAMRTLCDTSGRGHSAGSISGSVILQDCVKGVLRRGLPILRTSCSHIAL